VTGRRVPRRNTRTAKEALKTHERSHLRRVIPPAGADEILRDQSVPIKPTLLSTIPASARLNLSVEIGAESKVAA
jgi:hypothetical protein